MVLIQSEPKKITMRTPSRLPAEYQEVEYIESSGTQYIDTGWTPSSNYCKTVMNATIYIGGSSWSVFYGMTNGSSAYSLHTNQSTLQLNIGSDVNKNTGIYFYDGTNGTFTFEANNGSISVDITGSTYTGSYSGSVSQSTRPLYIFAFNENGSTTWKSKMRVNSYKIYSGANTIERDFVPCYRKADSVIGMYDLVNDQFYTNAGTGTFTKGNNVNGKIEIKKIVIFPDGVTEKVIRPTNQQQQIVISAALSPSTNRYPLGINAKPKKITITYTSYHATNRADQVIGIGINNNYSWSFNCGDGKNYSYDRCWLMFYTGSESRIVQDKYASTGERQTVLTLERDKSSVQQGNAAEASGQLSSAQQDMVDSLFNDYANLKLLCAGTRSYLTSDVVIDVEY